MNRIKRIVVLSSIAVFACTLTGCASCQRFFKSWDSNMQNGLQRSIEEQKEQKNGMAWYLRFRNPEKCITGDMDKES